MNRYFEDKNYGTFNGNWFDYFNFLGESIVQNPQKNIKYVLLTPTASVLPFAIATGAIKGFLKSDVSTGFKNLNEIWEELQKTELGTEVHVVMQTTKGVEKKTGALHELAKEYFLIKEKKSGKLDEVFGLSIKAPGVKIAISKNKDYELSEKSVGFEGGLDLKDFNIYYEEVDPLGLIGLPNNLIQISGNKKTLEKESEQRFFIEYGEKGKNHGFANFRFRDLLLTKNALAKNIEVTKLCSVNEKQLSLDANLTIFIQSENTNIEHVMDWENEFPQVIIIPRTLRKSTSLISTFNQEYLYRLNEEEITSYPQNIPTGCEIMAYEV